MLKLNFLYQCTKKNSNYWEAQLQQNCNPRGRADWSSSQKSPIVHEAWTKLQVLTTRPTLVPGSLSNSEFSRQTSNHELLDMTSNLWCNLWCSSQATCYLATRLLEHKAPGGQDKTKPAFKRFRNIAAIISPSWSSKQRTPQIMEKSH